MSHSTVAQVLRDRALQVHYQPIVRLKDGEILSSEGLIRGPAGTALHAPDAFFAAAAREEIGRASCRERVYGLV